MANKLDEHDAQKLEKAQALINEVYVYNYDGWSPLSNKLETIHRKINKLLETERESR